jgi:AmiR/NasT family two-component response regulator
MATFIPDDRVPHLDLAQCQAENADLRASLESRPVIDQAKGILMAQHGCSPDEAFGLLRAASQRDNRKVRDLAQAIVDGAQHQPDTAAAS